MTSAVDMMFFLILRRDSYFFFFFFNDTATTEIYTLSLHDALPISMPTASVATSLLRATWKSAQRSSAVRKPDRKSTRLNSSHLVISYAVFCLKKKKISVTDTVTQNVVHNDRASISLVVDCPSPAPS